MKIVIDAILYEVKAGKNILEACIGLGLDLPYFCYHPAMGSVGACRQCAVKKFANSEDRKGKIVMACMEPVTEGMIISIADPEVAAFRASVIESLMTNHPHDCPICDEGGECHLQDMTVMTGHNYRRFTFKKRTYISQNLGPFIQHEMNRCIQCYRCVRFYRNYAGGKDLNVFGSASQLYFGRKEDGVLENEFSGNLVEVCPTGVFTDKTLKKHFTRKWDLTNSPSICVHCSVGCNTLIGERYGMVRRVMNRYHGEINRYFLCDRGRFGYEFLNNPSRIKNILLKNGTAPSEIGTFLNDLAEKGNKTRIIGIGSPRASLESNYALLKLAGKENFFGGIPGNEHNLINRALALLNNQPVHAASLKEIEKCDAAFILGEDITHTAPLMALSVRQMVRNKGIEIAEKAGIPGWNDAASREITQQERSPLYIASPYATDLDEIAMQTFRGVAADTARLGFAVAGAIDDSAPRINDADNSMQDLAGRIASDLLSAKNPLIITGIWAADDSVLDAVNNIIKSLAAAGRKTSLAIAFPESNSVGLSALNAGNLEDAMESALREPADLIVILENDLYRRMSPEKADRLLSGSRKIIAIDHILHETTRKADMILPAAPYAESSGTIVNNEGRAQRYYPVLPAVNPVKESWEWIREIMHTLGMIDKDTWKTFDEVVSSMAHYFPALSHIKNTFPNAGFRYLHQKVARQTLRFSGRTAITAGISVSEPKPPEDYNSPLNFSMEGYKGHPPATLIPYYWSPGWNSPQAINKYLDEPNGSVKDGDPGVLLFINRTGTVMEYVKKIPDPFRSSASELYLIPVHRIFGSEEMSARGEAIAQRIPGPFLILNEKEMKRLVGDRTAGINLTIGNLRLTVDISTDNSIPDGVAGLFPGPAAYLEYPAYGVTDSSETTNSI